VYFQARGQHVCKRKEQERKKEGKKERIDKEKDLDLHHLSILFCVEAKERVLNKNIMCNSIRLVFLNK
jgi:hypothetical protein